MIDGGLLRKLHTLKIIINKPVRAASKGNRRSKDRGNSLEFADFRSYVQGDDLRLIDWKIYARHNQLFLKSYEDEQTPDVHIFIDSSSSMGLNNNEKFDFAKKLGCVLGFIAINSHENVQTVLFGDKLKSLSKTPGHLKNVPRFFDFIGKQPAAGKTMLAESINEYLSRKKNIKGIVFIITDAFIQDEINRALNVLGGQNCDIAFLHLTSAYDKYPPVEKSIRVIDVETGEKKEVSITKAVLENYKAAFTEWQAGVENNVNKRGMRYVCIDVGSRIESVVSNDLRRNRILS